MASLQGFAGGWRDLPSWAFVSGGALGVVYLISAIFLTPRIGAAATMGFVISRPIARGSRIDGFGFFGLPRFALTTPRLLGAGLLLGGALMLRFA